MVDVNSDRAVWSAASSIILDDRSHDASADPVVVSVVLAGVVELLVPRAGENREPCPVRTRLEAEGHRVPEGAFALASGGVSIISAGPDRYLALTEATERSDLDGWVTAMVPTGVYASDQSDSWVALDIIGHRAGEVITRGSSVDVDPRAFAPTHAAATAFAHIPIVLTRLSGDRGFRVLCQRSYAQSLCRDLQSTAAAIIASSA